MMMNNKFQKMISPILFVSTFFVAFSLVSAAGFCDELDMCNPLFYHSTFFMATKEGIDGKCFAVITF